MSVVMATFMVSMIPRASVSADRIQEVLDTDAERRAAGRPGARRRRSTARSSCATSASTTRAPSTPVLSDISFTTAPGHDHGDRRQHRRGQDDARQPHPPAVRRHRRRRCSSAASTCASSTPTCCGARIGLVPQRPYLFSGTVASNLQFGKPDATEDEMWEALEVAQAADFVRGDAGRARGAHRAGRHQRVRRPAPAAVDRPGPGPQARHLRVRRLVLGARPRHRRPAARRARSVHDATPPS